MENIVVHFLKSHLLLVLFFLVYRTLLARQGWFQMNRSVLLTLPLIALVTPFFTWPVRQKQLAEIFSYTLPEMEVGATSAAGLSIDWLFVISTLYLLGSLTLLVLLAFRLTKILTQKGGISENGYRIIRSSEGSFSFFKTIYVHKNLNESSSEIVIRHEKVHADQWHSADTLLYEVYSLLLWCNPAIWLLKKELRDTHEFIADRALSRDVAPREYVNALLNETFGTHSMQFLPMFNHKQTLIKRVKMMNLKNLKIQRLRYALALPLVAIIGFAAACTDQSENLKPDKTEMDERAAGQLEEPLTIADQMPEYPGGTEALFAYLGENIEYPEKAKQNETEGVVFIQFIIEKDGSIGDITIPEGKGIGDGCDKEARRVVSEMPNWSPGIHEGNPVRVVFNLPIRFALNTEEK